jgi:hypothetical protein
MALKHTGKMKNNGAKVLVAYRTLPGESDNALVVDVARLTDAQHDELMKVVESNQAQTANELADVLSRRYFPDGRQMLMALHTDGRLKKVATSGVIMTPTSTDTVVLSELNQMIAEQKGITVDQLAVTETEETIATAKDTPSSTSEAAPTEVRQDLNAPLTDDDLARQYRSQADAMYKEAKRLRDEAEKLVPTKKKTTAKKKEVDVSA